MLKKLTYLLMAAVILFAQQLPLSARSQNSHKRLIKRCIPAVVMIVRSAKYNRLRVGRITGTGSGVVIHPKGYIITNFHNLGSTRTGEILYQLYAYFVSSKNPYDAPIKKAYRLKLINSNYKFDLALLKIDAIERNGRFVNISNSKRFPYLKIADSSKIEPTDGHYALGFPKVARLGRKILSGITVLDGKVVGLDKKTKWIKTNAEISPGNSGGPSIDLKGRIIGINSAVKVERRTQGRISLIRPINLARHLAKGTPAYRMFKAGGSYTVDDHNKDEDQDDDDYDNQDDDEDDDEDDG